MVIGVTFWDGMRWLGVSTKPPVPMTAPSVYCRIPASTAWPVASITWSRETCSARRRLGFTSTCICFRRSPQIATFATPGTPSSRARIFQYVVIDRSMSDMSFDDRPIFMIRLVAETGGIITGGAAQVGSVGATVLRCSWTSWRAVRKSAPRLNRSVMCESCGTDSERMTSTPGTPFMASSSGTVTSSSTSEADRPRHAVCSSTRVGANSGNTSTLSSRSSRPPKTTRAAASATTRKRNRRLDPTIQRIT